VRRRLAAPLIALYFTLILPLLARIPMGFYGEGVWADANGVIYGAEVGPKAVIRYVKK